MLKKISVFFWVAILVSCNSAEQKSIKKIKLSIKGSDTVYPLSKLIGTSFQQQNKNAEIVVQGGGTTAGIADLLAGKIDVAAASRELKPSEKILIDSLKKGLLTYTIAYDGLAVIVNAQNKMNKITREQLKAIYQGKITNWKELGEKKEKIRVYGLEKNNSIDEFFRDKLMGEEDYSPLVYRLTQPRELIKKVAATDGAIGYCNILQMSTKVNYLAVSYDSSKTFIAPNAFNFQNRSYPISRALYYFTDASKEAEMKLLLDYSKSLLGKRNIVEMGFIPPQ